MPENPDFLLTRARKSDDAAVDSDSLGTIAKIASLTPLAGHELRFALQSESARLLPDLRVAKCLRRPVPGQQAVKLMHSPSAEAAHYKNLQVCSSVWMCPVCASKITERRREELAGALAASDLTPILVTFTLSHHQDDSLKLLTKVLLTAFRDFTAGAGWQAQMRRYHWLGSVKGLEVTHGFPNGWHPHLHILALLERPLERAESAEFTEMVTARWLMVLGRHGGVASWEHGVDVRTARADIADYIAKYGKLPESEWTLEHELTKSPVKRGRRLDRRSPFQLLWLALNGDKEAATLFREYARAMKGKHQLQWSRGARALLGLGAEASDEQLATEEREPSYVLLYLTLDQWHVIVANDCRAELLRVARSGDRVRVCNWLADLGIYVYDNERFDTLIPLADGVGVGVIDDEF